MRGVYPIRWFLNTLMVAVLVSGCAESPGSAASPVQSASQAQTETASPAPALKLLAIGDSIAASERCECPRFPDVYAPLAAEALGRPVWVQNRAVSGSTSGDLLDTLQSSPLMQTAVQEADIIMVSIGINDLGPCEGTDRACYESAIAGLQTNLEAILDQIDALQGDHPHILRQTAYYNTSIGDPAADQLGPSFQTFYAEQLAALNITICEAVAAHDGLCVDLLTAFNRAAGDQDAAPLLTDDHVHPSRAGHETIAQLLAASGYAPLGPQR